MDLSFLGRPLAYVGLAIYSAADALMLVVALLASLAALVALVALMRARGAAAAEIAGFPGLVPPYLDAAPRAQHHLKRFYAALAAMIAGAVLIAFLFSVRFAG